MTTETAELVKEDILVKEDEQSVKHEEVAHLFQSEGAGATEALHGRGFSYRHDWGNRKGVWDLTLNWGAINRNSRVFVSASEGAPGNSMFIGAANYTVHNVASLDGGVKIRLEIKWNSDIRVTVNYLVINP